ncbi:hypothetical protein AMJ80_12435 [bacterium SM23_31]|nr:MAG: hypothetical protein AMJ80_12435 [bacterium SM23_31]
MPFAMVSSGKTSLAGFMAYNESFVINQVYITLQWKFFVAPVSMINSFSISTGCTVGARFSW